MPDKLMMTGPVADVEVKASLNVTSGMLTPDGVGSAASLLLPMMVEVIS